MARKVKAGKFKYNLETVLKVRGIREKKEQEKFADKKRAYLKEKDEEERLRDEKKGEENTIRTAFRKGPISDFEKVMRRHAHLGILKEDIENQVEKVIEASRTLEDQREKLVSAIKDKKIMEKDKEKTLDKYKKLMQDLELKFLDEIATQRFTRDKREQKEEE
jgi:flagellar FliJ protein